MTVQRDEPRGLSPAYLYDGIVAFVDPVARLQQVLWVALFLACLEDPLVPRQPRWEEVIPTIQSRVPHYLLWMLHQDHSW